MHKFVVSFFRPLVAADFRDLVMRLSARSLHASGVSALQFGRHWVGMHRSDKGIVSASDYVTNYMDLPVQLWILNSILVEQLLFSPHLKFQPCAPRRSYPLFVRTSLNYNFHFIKRFIICTVPWGETVASPLSTLAVRSRTRFCVGEESGRSHVPTRSHPSRSRSYRCHSWPRHCSLLGALGWRCN